jgi:hypothetical protein
MLSGVRQYEPAGHMLSLVDPAAQYDDTLHVKLNPFLQYLPAGHMASAEDPSTHSVPSAHMVGVDVLCMQ